ncbi:hypothetical protein JOB18_004400 [Solea senegalensis]|uniref:Uncharacterized protein n=1 Tax=Solea senegalensis TaxID=28829 RepID=A0AAV6SJN3_SOLSE|nr:hypothetical protein JOB18_004400 [Solea senegalensis]
MALQAPLQTVTAAEGQKTHAPDVAATGEGVTSHGKVNPPCYRLSIHQAFLFWPDYTDLRNTGGISTRRRVTAR